MIKNIIIPMAGLGKRFKKNNFSTIKPLIQIDNSTIFDKYGVVKKILKKNKISPFLLDKDTLGQSDTCYKVINKINHEEDLFIHSCDYVMKYSYKKFLKTIKNSDVVIFTYRLKSTIVKNYNDYAYCMLEKGIVKKITEKTIISKKPSSDHMIIGTFWFKKSKDFFDMHKISLSKKNFINNELYIANNINFLIKKNKNVKIFEVDYWKNLGDVFSYNQYIYWKNFFENLHK